MTFQEALVKKAKLPAAITYKGSKMKIYLVPLLEVDVEKFIAHLAGHRITNNTALKFSTNNQFTVKGIMKINDVDICLSYNALMNEIDKVNSYSEAGIRRES